MTEDFGKTRRTSQKTVEKIAQKIKNGGRMIHTEGSKQKVCVCEGVGFPRDYINADVACNLRPNIYRKNSTPAHRQHRQWRKQRIGGIVSR